MDEKREFSERLRNAMSARKLDISAAVLERGFNQIWEGGRPIRRQTAWKWLNGESIPTQDKLQELSRWLKVDPDYLRFGRSTAFHVRELAWHEKLEYVERKAFEAFLNLPEPQRKLVRELILALAKAQPPSER
jgi:transcriptional regulator with XRE-family HTH domain